MSIKNQKCQNFEAVVVGHDCPSFLENKEQFGDNISFMLHTTNGGSTWSTQSLPFNSKVYRMYFWDANHGWATSDFGPLAKYSSPVGSYSNASLNGPWLFYSDVNPIDPFNNNLNYFVFDGNGNITDFNG